MTETVNNKADALREIAHQLRSAWVSIDAVDEELDEIEAEIKSSPLGKQREEARLRISDLKDKLSSLETDARILTLELAELTGDKKPVPGFGVRKRTEFEITDMDAMVEWCKENLPLSVISTVDQKAVKKYVLGLEPEAVPYCVSISIDEFGDSLIYKKEIMATYDGDSDDDVPF